MNMRPVDLTSLQIFRGLDDDAASSICSHLETQSFATNEEILREGDDTQALWIILSGECIVSRSGETDERILAVLNAGDVFGEMSFVRTAPHSASITAASPVKVCSYDRKHFLKLTEEQPQAAYRVTANIAAVLAERLRRMDTWICDLFESSSAPEQRDEWQHFRAAVYTNWEF